MGGYHPPGPRPDPGFGGDKPWPGHIEHGQASVALSRVRSMAGVLLTGLRYDSLTKANPHKWSASTPSPDGYESSLD